LWIRLGKEAGQKHLIEGIAAPQQDELNMMRLKEIGNAKERRLLRQRRLSPPKVLIVSCSRVAGSIKSSGKPVVELPWPLAVPEPCC